MVAANGAAILHPPCAEVLCRACGIISTTLDLPATLDRLLIALRDVPSREWAWTFGALVVLWALTELFVGRLGLHAVSLESDRGSALAVLASAAVAWTLAMGASVVRLLPVGADWARWAGLGVMAAGLALRVFSILWLGPMFTRLVQILPGHRLVTSGPYRFVRHPSYSGLLLFFMGVGLALGDWLAVAIMVFVPTVGVLYRIRVEEKTLLGAFGEEYRAYMHRVGGLLPLPKSVFHREA
ncbi:MAG TPA: isoprenylcysteine carboxylmethyltransferase family protein [Chloroflexia bacterium]|nr:isoprenylcysteine carboxylmethyltransferase family protein [Chloroflexia bacterium]